MSYDRDSWVGRKVIARSNEDEPAKVGTLNGWTEMHGDHFPLVDFDGEEFICFSVLLPYNKGVLEALDAMEPKEAWEFARDFSLLNQLRTGRG